MWKRLPCALAQHDAYSPEVSHDTIHNPVVSSPFNRDAEAPSVLDDQILKCAKGGIVESYQRLFQDGDVYLRSHDVTGGPQQQGAGYRIDIPFAWLIQLLQNIEC